LTFGAFVPKVIKGYYVFSDLELNKNVLKDKLDLKGNFLSRCEKFNFKQLS